MSRWLRSIFAWRSVFIAGVWDYQENTVTGERRAHRINVGGYSPIDLRWLNQGRQVTPR